MRENFLIFQFWLYIIETGYVYTDIYEQAILKVGHAMYTNLRKDYSIAHLKNILMWRNRKYIDASKYLPRFHLRIWKKGERGKATIGRLMMIHINPVYTVVWMKLLCSRFFIVSIFDLTLVLIPLTFNFAPRSLCLFIQSVVFR